MSERLEDEILVIYGAIIHVSLPLPLHHVKRTMPGHLTSAADRNVRHKYRHLQLFIADHAMFF